MPYAAFLPLQTFLKLCRRPSTCISNVKDIEVIWATLNSERKPLQIPVRLKIFHSPDEL